MSILLDTALYGFFIRRGTHRRTRRVGPVFLAFLPFHRRVEVPGDDARELPQASRGGPWTNRMLNCTAGPQGPMRGRAKTWKSLSERGKSNADTSLGKGSRHLIPSALSSSFLSTSLQLARRYVNLLSASLGGCYLICARVLLRILLRPTKQGLSCAGESFITYFNKLASIGKLAPGHLGLFL